MHDDLSPRRGKLACPDATERQMHGTGDGLARALIGLSHVDQQAMAALEVLMDLGRFDGVGHGGLEPSIRCAVPQS